jgi:hypothetical protein
MPTYYIMDRDRTMPETVAPFMPTAAEIDTCAWLPEAELRVSNGTLAGHAGCSGSLCCDLSVRFAVSAAGRHRSDCWTL